MVFISLDSFLRVFRLIIGCGEYFINEEFKEGVSRYGFRFLCQDSASEWIQWDLIVLTPPSFDASLKAERASENPDYQPYPLHC